MATRIVAFEGSAFFVNGMNVSFDQAKETCLEIAKSSSSPVTLCYNDATTQFKMQGMFTNLMKGFRGIASSYNEFQEIQKRKEELSRDLASKVTAFLSNNCFSRVTLIGHSQGADILYLATQLLNPYKGRIHIMTLGGKTLIPKNMGKIVYNFVESKDWIAKGAEGIFTPQGAEFFPLNDNCSTPFCHEMKDYLANHYVQNAISLLTKPIIHELREIPVLPPHPYDPGSIRFATGSAS